jgi:integrase
VPTRCRHGRRKRGIAKLTKRTIDALKPQAKAYVAYDRELHGFGVRVMPSGHKSFIVEYRPHGGGRGNATRRLTLGALGALTPDQARRAAQEALARVRLGNDPQAEKARQRVSLTVGGLIDAFLEGHASSKLKAKTAGHYRIALERLRAAHGSLKAHALTRSHLAALHLSQAGTPFAANRFLASVSKCFSWGLRRGLLPEGHVNPARGLERYREHRRERFLTSEELSRLGDALREGETEGLPYWVDESRPMAKHAPKPENRRTMLDPFAVAAIRLLTLTGARLREILHAKWEHVDFERGILFLPDSKTGRKPVYLSAATLAILAGLPRLEGNPHIIAGMKDGAPRADLKKPWAAVTKAAKLEGVRIHDLRHSFASFGAGASLGLPIIGKLLGHTQAATTHRYAHLDADPMRRAAETIGATIAAAMGGAYSNVVPMAKSR